MPVTHDDMPHPVPPIAFLRYKENWFFLILDQANEVFGAIHIVGEPGSATATTPGWSAATT